MKNNGNESNFSMRFTLSSDGVSIMTNSLNGLDILSFMIEGLKVIKLKANYH
ncbi:hypothetical protein ACSVDA_00380 [Cytobacillus sp. Hm23]